MPATLADIQQPTYVNVPGVELCSVGTWNGRPYTAAELADVAANWLELRGQWDVPLTLGHDGESALGDGEPAFGWLDNVLFANDILYGDYVKVPVPLARVLPTAYPKRSCTFIEGATIAGKKRGLVLRNVALLGAHQPAVDGLADVLALYNKRQLAAEGGRTVTLTEATMPSASLAVSLARLPAAAQDAYYGWRAKHPQKLDLVAGPSAAQMEAAVKKMLQAAGYPEAEGDSDSPGADGPSQNILDMYISGGNTSVIVSDQDVDNLFEIAFTYDAASDTATPDGSPIPVKGTYTAASPGTESGDPAASEPADSGADAGAADEGAPSPADASAPAAPADGDEVQNTRRLAAAVADSAVEELITKAHTTFDDLLTAVNGIATGKPGVAEFRAMLQAAEKSLDRIKVAKPAAGESGDAPTPPPPAAKQNARQEESDVKISELARTLGLPATATEDEVMRAVEGAAASRGVVTTLARKVDALLERDAEKEIEAQMATAVAEGRLKRWAKPGVEGEMYGTIRKLARNDMTTAQSILNSLPRFIDTEEYGRAGNDGTPNTDIPAGVARELRKLGRDPETLDRRPLGDRWNEQIRERQKAHALKLGLPVRSAVTTR